MSLATPPDDPAALEVFPGRSLDPHTPLYRLFRASHTSVFYFSSRSDANGGRYDLAPPNGSCYLAETPVGAWLEVFRSPGTIDHADLEARRMAEVLVPEALDLADLTHPNARSHGVTAEIHAGPDYGIPRQWAERLHQAGWRGLAGLARHDPGALERTVTLLGSAGAHHPFGITWDITISGLENNPALHEAVQSYGYEIARVPFEFPTVEPS